MKEKKDSTILEAFLSLVLLLFLRYNPRFPLAYKRESKAPHEGDPESIDPSRSDTDPHKSMTQTHSRAAIELSAPTHSFHQRLGIISLSSSFVTYTTNFQC